MALTTYTELKAAVATWLNRVDLTTPIVDGITLAEAQFQRTIRNRNMEQRATATATQYMELPTDYIEMRRLHIQGTPNGPLKLIAPEEANSRYSGSTDEPVAYTLIGNEIQLSPSPDTNTYTIEIDYYKKIPVLSGSNATNWLLTAYPDLYLLGAILAMTFYTQNDQRMPMVQSQYQALLADVNGIDRRQRFSGAAPFQRAA